jgi:hypothetical protein
MNKITIYKIGSSCFFERDHALTYRRVGHRVLNRSDSIVEIAAKEKGYNVFDAHGNKIKMSTLSDTERQSLERLQEVRRCVQNRLSETQQKYLSEFHNEIF